MRDRARRWAGPALVGAFGLALIYIYARYGTLA